MKPHIFLRARLLLTLPTLFALLVGCAAPEQPLAATTAQTTTVASPTTVASAVPNVPQTTQERKHVTICADGTEQTFETAAATLAELLSEIGFACSEYDEIRPHPSSDVYDGMFVTVTRVERTTITAEVELDFATETREDPTLYIGETVELTAGVCGRKQLVLEQLLRGGELVASRVVSSEILAVPVNRVLLVGTKQRPVTTTAPVTTVPATKKTTVPTTKATSTTPKTTVPTTPAVIQSEPEAITVSVNGTVYGVSKVINGEAVAYYSKKANPSTATGNPAIPGKTIAVDPKVIPLGSIVYITSVDGTSWSYGPAYAHDVGGGIKGNIVDLFKASYEECVAHGRRNCIIYILAP